MEAKEQAASMPIDPIPTEFKLRRGGVFYVDGYAIKILRIRRGDVDVSVTKAGPMLLTRSGIDDGRKPA